MKADITVMALSAGLKTALHQGAASCVWSDGISGVTQADLELYTQHVAARCAEISGGTHYSWEAAQQIRAEFGLAATPEQRTPAALPVLCRAINGGLDVSIAAAALRFGAENHPDYWDGNSGADVPNIKVIDLPVFAGEVANAINAEAEDGSTLLTRMLDRAIADAFESGCEGVNHD